MGQEFKSIEECLLTLEATSRDYLISVYIGKSGGPEYSILTNADGGLVPLHRLRGTQPILKYILESIREGRRAYFGYNSEFENEIYSFGEKDQVGLVYFGDFSLVKKPGKGRPLPTVEFENGTVCSSYKDYMEFFGLTDNYTNRGKVMSWVNSHLEEASKGEEKTYTFNQKKVKGFTSAQTRFKTEIQVLSYEGLPDMFGFGAIVKTFPNITLKQVENLYSSQGVKMPSTVRKHFRDKKKAPSKPQKPQKTPGVKQNPGEFDYYITTYNLHPSDTKGYLNFKASYGDVVVNNSRKLAEELRGHGEVITYNEAQSLWNTVMKGDED